MLCTPLGFHQFINDRFTYMLKLKHERTYAPTSIHVCITMLTFTVSQHGVAKLNTVH